MKHLARRSLIKHAALGAAVAIAALAGCGKKEEPKPAAAPMPAPAPAAAPAPAPGPLKVGFVYVGPVGDAGWTFAHDLGRKHIEEKFGDRIKTTFVEKVPEGADAERVIRDLVAQGNTLIFATSFGFGDAMAKVAKDHPEVKFEHATGYKTADNLRVYEGRFYEDAYMAGVIAGRMTKTDVLGFVASFPIPEVLRNINAFTLGAQSVNPKVTTKVVWVNTWFDPPKESEAAQIKSLGNTSRSSMFLWDTERERNGWHEIHAWVVDGQNNTWKTETTKWGTKEGMNDLVKIADFVPDDVKAEIDKIKAGLKDGTFAVFRGPILDNTGKEVLAKDAVADDAWKGGINFYVKGVEGSVPAGK